MSYGRYDGEAELDGHERGLYALKFGYVDVHICGDGGERIGSGGLEELLMYDMVF